MPKTSFDMKQIYTESMTKHLLVLCDNEGKHWTASCCLSK